MASSAFTSTTAKSLRRTIDQKTRKGGCAAFGGYRAEYVQRRHRPQSVLARISSLCRGVGVGVLGIHLVVCICRLRRGNPVSFFAYLQMMDSMIK